MPNKICDIEKKKKKKYKLGLGFWCLTIFQVYGGGQLY
jgi:hypothetical protein